MQLSNKSAARGLQGEARISIARNVVTVTMAENRETFSIPKADCPTNVRNGTWYVNLNRDGTRMFSLRPMAGIFEVKYLKMAAAENQDPKPYHDSGARRRADGTTYNVDRLMFKVILTIANGDNAGMEVPLNMEYAFDNVDGTAAIQNRRARAVQQLIRFFEVHGLMDEGIVIPYSANILPDLDELLLSHKRKFGIVMAKGWIDSIAPAADGGTRPARATRAAAEEPAPTRRAAAPAARGGRVAARTPRRR